MTMFEIKNKKMKKIIKFSILSVVIIFLGCSGFIFANFINNASDQEPKDLELVKKENSHPLDVNFSSGSESDSVNETESKNNVEKPIEAEAKTTSVAYKPQRKKYVKKSKKTQSNNHNFDFTNWNKSCDPKLIVINRDNLIPDNYNMQIVNYGDKQVNKIAEKDLDCMIKDAKKEGINLYVSSGYRTIERQTMLFNREIESFKKKGYKGSEAEKAAATVVARPKTSEHNLGIAIDFNGVRDDFYKTKEYAWLMQHAPDYGFILRYDRNKESITHVIYEPWHFRYVGREYARDIARSGLSLEEYIRNIKVN